MNRVYAKWRVSEPPENLDSLYISCGVDDDQWIGYFLDDKNACLTYVQDGDTYLIIFSAPSCGLENNKGWWLSPAVAECSEMIEAFDFGIMGASETELTDYYTGIVVHQHQLKEVTF